MALLNFDARTVAPDPGVQEPIPAGWYNVVMVQSELKPTSDGTGQRLAIVFQVIDGQYMNRKVFTGLNLVNTNAAAQEIAYKQLSAIGHAVGHVMIGDSTELHNKPLKIKVKIKPASGQYEAGNDISAYKNINEVVTAPGPANPFAAPPAIPAAPVPPGNAQWTPPPAAVAPQAPATPQWAPPAAPAATAQPQWAPPPATAPAQPWAPPAAATVAPQAPAPAAVAPQPVGMQPAWAQAPAPAAAPAPTAPPQLQPPPGFAAPAAAPAAAAPAPQQYAPPAGQPAPIQPPWATPAA